MPERNIQWAAGALVGHLAQRDRLVTAMHDEASAQPGAQVLEQDRITGHETHLFCFDHQRDPADCNRARKSEEDPICTGVPIPAAMDPTGENAHRQADRGDERALAGEKELEHHEQTIVRAMARIQELRDEFTPGSTPAIPSKVVMTSASHAGEPGCESCARLEVGQDGERRPWWSEANYNRGDPTNLGGALDRRMRLCRPCAEWALNHKHDRCIAQAAEQRKAKKGRKVISFDNPIHLPPLRDGEENLDNKRRSGYWRGKPGRAV